MCEALTVLFLEKNTFLLRLCMTKSVKNLRQELRLNVLRRFVNICKTLSMVKTAQRALTMLSTLYIYSTLDMVTTKRMKMMVTGVHLLLVKMAKTNQYLSKGRLLMNVCRPSLNALIK